MACPLPKMAEQNPIWVKFSNVLPMNIGLVAGTVMWAVSFGDPGITLCNTFLAKLLYLSQKFAWVLFFVFEFLKNSFLHTSFVLLKKKFRAEIYV